MLFDETTRTLFCGDLFTQTGEGPAIVHDADLIQPALDAEDLFGATALTANTAPTMRQLAELEPRTLALMHGPAYAGDCRQALLDLADAYEARFTALDLAGWWRADAPGAHHRHRRPLHRGHRPRRSTTSSPTSPARRSAPPTS